MNLFQRSKEFGMKVKGFIWQKNLNWLGLVLFVLGIATGLFFTAQWRTKPSRASDPVISYSSLIQTKESLLKEQEQLKQTIQNLTKEASKGQEELKKFANSKEKVEKVEALEKEVGLEKVTGKGIILKFADANGKEENITAESITHAADLRDIVNFLWGQGAKAISINGERIVTTTSIDCIVNTILINSTKTTPPFEIKVIGNQDYLVLKLNDKNNLKNIHKRINEEGLVFEIKKEDNIEISSYTGSLNINYAKIDD